MIHNDVLRSVRYMLDISDNKMVEIIKLGGMEVALADVVTWLDKKEEDEEGFVRCPDEVIAHFLDGLVIDSADDAPAGLAVARTATLMRDDADKARVAQAALDLAAAIAG